MLAMVTSMIIEEKNDKQKLTWTTPIKQILPEFELEDPYRGDNATIEDALSHRIGQSAHNASYGWTGPSSRELVKNVRHLPLCAPFRTEFHYNNIMYAIVSAAVEELEQKPCQAVLKERIWQPLGMEKTTWDLAAAAKTASSDPKYSLARGYYWVAKEGCYVPDCYLDLGPVVGAGANISTVNEYALWVKDLLAASGANISTVNEYALWMKALLTATSQPDESGDNGSATKPKRKSPITRHHFSAITHPRTIIGESVVGASGPKTPVSRNDHLNPNMYALGWAIHPRRFPGHSLIGHGGGLPGFGTQVYLCPDDDFGVVTMANTSITSNVVGDILAQELIGRKLGFSKEHVDRVTSTLKFDEYLDPKPKTEEERAKPHRHGGMQTLLDQQEGRTEPEGSFEQYAGKYHHTAYGTCIVTAVDEKFLSSLLVDRKPKLRKPDDSRGGLWIELPGHVWKSNLVLRQEQGRVFTLENLSRHGTMLDEDPMEGLPDGTDDGEKARARKMKVWHTIEEARSGGGVFVVEGEKIVKMGLVIESDLDDATEKWGKSWEEGMIWFEKVE